MALNIPWQDHMRNSNLYAGWPKATKKIREHLPKLAGHCVRHSELAPCPIILWEPTQGKASRGRRCLSFVDTLERDIGLTSAEELHSFMLDRNTNGNLEVQVVIEQNPKERSDKTGEVNLIEVQSRRHRRFHHREPVTNLVMLHQSQSVHSLHHQHDQRRNL